MINVMENKVLGPILQQRFEEGFIEGFIEGFEEGHNQGFKLDLEQVRKRGQQVLLQNMLTEKFGPLPAWADQRIRTASTRHFDLWASLILRSSTLEGTLRDPE